MSKSKATNNLIRTDRDDKIFAKRIEGKSFSKIANELKISPSTAANVVRKRVAELGKDVKEQAQEALQVDLARLDRATETIMELIDHPTEKAITKLASVDKLVKLVDARAKLLGVYGMEQQAPTVNVNIATDQLAALSIEELRKKFSNDIQNKSEI